MAHTHPVKDSDKHFVINPVTRAIENAQHKKTKLMQHDHNSEKFTFEIPQVVEGHDLSKCNRIQIHYCNTDAVSRATSLGVYKVGEILAQDSLPTYGGVEQGTEDYVMEFSWLISKNATKYAGPLGFAIVFSCIENDEEVYRWSTDINTSISIATSMANEDDILESYPDVFVQMKEELRAAVFGYKVMGSGPAEPTTGSYMWLNTSVFETEEIKSYVEQQGDVTEHTGIVVVRGEDGSKKVLYPVTKLAAVEDADEILIVIRNLAQDAKDTADATNEAAANAKTDAENAAADAFNARTAAEEAVAIAANAQTTAANAIPNTGGTATGEIKATGFVIGNAVAYPYVHFQGLGSDSEHSGKLMFDATHDYGRFYFEVYHADQDGVEKKHASFYFLPTADPGLTSDIYHEIYTSRNPPSPAEVGAIPTVGGATEGYIPVFKADGTLAASSTKLAKVMTSANFVLDGTTLRITTP